VVERRVRRRAPDERAQHRRHCRDAGDRAVAGDATYAGAIAAILAYPVVAVILLVGRHRIEP
jgi:hypothetical protein